MELTAYKEEGKFVTAQLKELSAKQAKGSLSPDEEVAQRVLREMHTEEKNFIKYPSLLNDR